MIMISRYQIKERNGRRYIVSYEHNVCPICSGILNVIGTRNRMVIDSGGTPVTVTIRRLRCRGSCGRIHHELPDIMIPYKRHCADTIEKIITGSEDGVDCDGSTIIRIREWWAAWMLYFKSILASLREKHGVAVSVSAPREIVRAVANAHLWPHTRSAFLPA